MLNPRRSTVNLPLMRFLHANGKPGQRKGPGKTGARQASAKRKEIGVCLRNRRTQRFATIHSFRVEIEPVNGGDGAIMACFD